MTRWNRIDGENPAPTDGTHVLLWVDGHAIEGWREHDSWELLHLGFHGCGCCGGWMGDHDVTHWKPLDAPTDQVQT